MTTPKVVGLHHDASFTHGEPEPGVVACLEDWLERAKAGELTGIAAATWHSDGSCSWRIRGRYRAASMIGCLEAVKADVVDDMRK